MSFNEDADDDSDKPERPTLFLTFRSRDDEKAYLKYLRSTYKFSIVNFGMICCVLGLLVFRFVLPSSPISGPFFYTALVANIIAYILIIIFLATHVEAIFFKGATLWARILDMVPFHAEDLIITWTTLSASLNMLYITVNLIGYDNLSHVGGAQKMTITDATVRAAQTIPFEQLIFMYIGSFILPIAFGAASKMGIVMTWLTSLAFATVRHLARLEMHFARLPNLTSRHPNATAIPQAIEIIVFSHSFPYLALCRCVRLAGPPGRAASPAPHIQTPQPLPRLPLRSHLFLLGALYEIEKNKVIIYNSYKGADKAAGENLEKEKKERMMRKREEIDRKLNEALLHAMVPKKVCLSLSLTRSLLSPSMSSKLFCTV